MLHLPHIKYIHLQRNADSLSVFYLAVSCSGAGLGTATHNAILSYAEWLSHTLREIQHRVSVPSKRICCSSPSNLTSITRKLSQIAQNDIVKLFGDCMTSLLGFKSLLQFSFAACYDLSAQKFLFLGTLASIPPLKSNLFAMLHLERSLSNDSNFCE